MPYRKEENWHISYQRKDGQNNDYYIFPKDKQAFWKLAEENGEIHLRFIGKYEQSLPCYQHIITVGKNHKNYTVSNFIRRSTIKNIRLSKRFKDTIILAAPKGAEDALEYRWIEFAQEEEPLSIAKEIKRQAILGQYFQEPIGPERKPQNTSATTHHIYNRDIRKKANAIRKANFLCEISNNHPLFKSRITNQNYLEAHHLIPLKYADLFSFSLDIEANIVAVCPHCHRLLHYGDKEEIKPILEQLFIQRKNLLASKEIHLTLEQLYAFYGSAD
ncbi:HNH endonuclease [Candidatus Avelusimicrobium fimicolum]|uniref:HNH endonuclease n=1 Tax=Candidatus Avelusimicrobium fimicolum TaxID=3416216 RepID=UPI0015B18E67